MYRLVRTIDGKDDTLTRDDQLPRIRRYMLRTARGVAHYIRRCGGACAMGIQPDRVTMNAGAIVFSIQKEPGP